MVSVKIFILYNLLIINVKWGGGKTFITFEKIFYSVRKLFYLEKMSNFASGKINYLL